MLQSRFFWLILIFIVSELEIVPVICRLLDLVDGLMVKTAMQLKLIYHLIQNLSLTGEFFTGGSAFFSGCRIALHNHRDLLDTIGNGLDQACLLVRGFGNIFYVFHDHLGAAHHCV